MRMFRDRLILVPLIAVAALVVFAASAAAEEVGSTTGTPDTGGPCGGIDCMVFQQSPRPGLSASPTVGGEVTTFSVRKDAGPLDIRLAVVSTSNGGSTYTVHSISDTFTLSAAAGEQAYPLVSPIPMEAGQFLGVVYETAMRPYHLTWTNGIGGAIAQIDNVTAPGTYPPAWTGANYLLLFKYTVSPKPFDLVVTTEPPHSLYIADGFWLASAVVDVTNAATSGRASDPTTLRYSVRENNPLPMVYHWYKQSDLCKDSYNGGSNACPVPAISPGAKKRSYATGSCADAKNCPKLPVGSSMTLGAHVDCEPAESDCTNNEVVFDVVVVAVADTKAKKPAATNVKQFGGTATGAGAAKRRTRVAGATKVDVALLRLAKGQIGFTGMEPVGPFGANKCAWLSGKLVTWKLTPIAGKTCGVPVWLRATGTASWLYTLRKRLPAGSYVLYSRGSNAKGGTEFSFTTLDGNRIPFTVRG